MGHLAVCARIVGVVGTHLVRTCVSLVFGAAGRSPTAMDSSDGIPQPWASRIERGGVILPLWLPATVFGHVFAFAFLLRALLLYFPQLKR